MRGLQAWYASRLTLVWTRWALHSLALTVVIEHGKDGKSRCLQDSSRKYTLAT